MRCVVAILVTLPIASASGSPVLGITALAHSPQFQVMASSQGRGREFLTDCGGSADAQFADEGVEGGREQEAEDGHSEHPAEHGRAKGLPHLGTSSTRQPCHKRKCERLS